MALAQFTLVCIRPNNKEMNTTPLNKFPNSTRKINGRNRGNKHGQSRVTVNWLHKTTGNKHGQSRVAVNWLHKTTGNTHGQSRVAVNWLHKTTKTTIQSNCQLAT